MTLINLDELLIVVGGAAVADSPPKSGGIVEREVGRIQREQPLGATRQDGTNEWNRRIDRYNREQPIRYEHWLRKQPIG